MLPNRVAEFADSLRPPAADGAPDRQGGFAAADVARAAALWGSVAAIPVPKRAYFGADGSCATIHLETADAATGKRAVVERTALLPQCRVLPAVTGAVAEEGTAPVFVSPSRKRALRFIKAGDDGWVTEVRDNATGAIVVRVASGKAHGAPVVDDSLQQVSWADDELSCVFVAERHRPKAPPAWTPIGKGDDTERAANELRESLGEVYPDFSATTLVRLDVERRSVRDLLAPAFSIEYSAASPVLSHDGTTVTFVGYLHKPRRLGIAYCSSRTTKLFTLANVAAASADNGAAAAAAPLDRTFCRNVRCLTRHPKTDAIAAAVAAEDSLAHASCSALVLLPADAVRRAVAEPMRRTVLVDVVATPETAAGFPGLYLTSNSDLRWLDTETLLVNSVRRSAAVLYTVHVDVPIPHLVRVDADVLGVPTTNIDAFGTLRVLDACDDAVLATYSTTSRPPVVLFCPNATKPGHQTWTRVLDTRDLLPAPVAAIAGGFTAQLVETTDAALHGTQAHLHMHAPFVSGEPRRTIVFVHGGPHACDTSMFSRSHFFMLLSGFNLMSVNYGGSLGFGQAAVDALGGKAGTSDVNDCVGVVRHAQAQGLLPTDAKRLIVTGGSHGGFLTGHLTGQAPDMFCVAAMRNPVTNIASMKYETDIPDWCLFEAGAAEHDVAAMLAASPMAHVGKVKTPTLVAIGRSDLRVPPAQGLAWFNEVRANGNGVECRLLDYSGVGHALDSVVAEAEFNIVALLWFNKFCAPSTD